MRSEKALIYIPLLLSTLLNPLLILPIYSRKMMVSSQNEIEVTVNQSESTLNVYPGDNVRGIIQLETLIKTQYQIDMHSSQLKIELDGVETSSKNIELEPGKHIFCFTWIPSDVGWVSRNVVFKLRTLDKEDNIAVVATIFPSNWNHIKTAMQLMGVFTILVGVSATFTGKSLGSKKIELEQIQDLKNKNKTLRKRLNASAARLSSLITWIDDLLQNEPGLYEKALAYPPTPRYGKTPRIDPIPLEKLAEDLDDDSNNRILVKLGDPLNKLKRLGGERVGR